MAAKIVLDITPPRPDLELTAADVARMTKSQREERLDALIEWSYDLLDRVERSVTESVYRKDGDHRRLVGTVAMFSGGHDSTVLAHLFRSRLTHALHGNTGIGIEATRQFVRDTCAMWNLPLIEEHGGQSYRDLVLDQGFPGPAQHFKMYQRLKERAFHKARHRFVEHSLRDRVIYLAGRRRDESKRRENVPAAEREGSIMWVSPMIYWTKPDYTTYRLRHRDVPRNEVSDLIHMSGECLCGSFAHENELDEIRLWYPDVVAEIEELEREVTALGVFGPERCGWGLRGGKPRGKAKRTGIACSSCVDPAEVSEIVKAPIHDGLTHRETGIAHR